MSSPRGYSDSSDDDNPKKRRKISDNLDIEERLESLISRVGDKSTSSSLESNLGGLANVLEADLGNHKKKILKIILNCAISLPQRLSVYSTLVGLLNAANYSAGGDFIDMLITLFKEALRENNYFTAVHLMRFLSDLVNSKVVMPSSMLDFYNIFLDVAFEESTPQTRADWLVYAVLSCLPWSGKELSEKKEVELDRLLSSIEGYLERRNKDFIPALLVWDDEEQEAKDKLDGLWIQIQDMRQSNWRDKMMRRLYLAFDSAFRDAHALQHTIPTITIPPYDKRFSPLPEMSFRIFDYSDIIEDAPRLPKEHSIDRFVVEETIQATIHANCFERKVCAEHLLNIEFKEKIPLNYLIIEAIFGQLFQMPDSPSIHLMYGVLLIELCKLQPSSMPQVLAQATMILYSKLDTMNASCIQRFSEWFSYHLSNFQFKWMWEDWMDCINLDLQSPKSKFVQETLKKCLRLSYYQRVVDIVPASFAKLLPPEPQPINKFANAEGEVNGSEHAEKVVESIKSKCSAEEMNTILVQLSVKGGNSTKIDIFLTSLLHLASKTPSHSFAAVAKYHSTLKMLSEGQNKQETQQLQVCILNVLQNLWANKPQMILILVDKFLKTQLVSCSAVVSWIFSPQMEGVINSFHIHEILESTVKKLRLHVEKELQLEKSSAKNKNKNDEDEDDDEEEDNSMDHGPETSVNLERCRRELEGLELLILEKLISAMMDHINTCEAQGRPFKSYKFQYLRDRLKEFLLKSQSARILSELKSKYYETNLHLSILKIFEMVQPLLL